MRCYNTLLIRSIETKTKHIFYLNKTSEQTAVRLLYYNHGRVLGVPSLLSVYGCPQLKQLSAHRNVNDYFI
jgi:hypothetical protein